MEIIKSLTLNTLNDAKELIQKANVSQLKEIIGRAEALRVYAAQAKKGLEIQNQVAEIKLRAERRIGEKLEKEVKQGQRSDLLQDVTSLKELGIERIESHRWQAVASLPEKDFEKHIKEVKKSNEELTTVGVIRLARELQGKIKKKAPPLPAGKFNVIYADPPWKYNDDCREGAIQSGGATRHYPVMSIDELCKLDIPSSENSVLFLWVTSPLLEDSFKIINTWGFQYKTSFVWDKIKHNMGHYNSVRHEFLLICVKGSFTPQNPKLYDSVYSEEKKEHSRKPEKFYEIIETLYPNGRYLELFSRNKRTGWTMWGNEL